MLYILLCLLYLAPNCLSMEHEEINKASSSVLIQMKRQLMTAYQTGDVSGISDIYLKYDQTIIPEDTFQQVKSQFPENSLDFYQWPNQKDNKERLGGWLFYPTFIEDWLDHPYSKGNLDTLPILLSCTYAGKYNHGLARFFVIRTLLNAYYQYDLSETKYKFLEPLRDNTIARLNLCTDHPYASYIMGRLHSDNAFMSYSKVDFEPKIALSHHERHGNDPRNKFWAVFIKNNYKAEREKTTALEIEEALKGYPLGFFAIVSGLIGDTNQISRCLGSLIGFSYMKVEKLCRDFYLEPSNAFNIIKELKKIGEAGQYIAYAELSEVIFEEIKEESFDLDNSIVSISLIRDALDLLKVAGEHGLYRAWIDLAEYQALLKNHREARLQNLYSFPDHIHSLKRAAFLGNRQAFDKLPSHLAQTYGSPIGSDELGRNIYKFLEAI